MRAHTRLSCFAALVLLGATGTGLADTGIVQQVRTALGIGQVAQASAEIDQYRAAHGATPELLEAMSWVARAELSRGDVAAARKWARDTYQLCSTVLKKRALDRDANAPLPIALGAAIEVEANVRERAARGQGEAYLRQQLQLFSRTSIRDRIQKNINLLSMVGKPAPLLQGATIPAGKVTLLFFWAHWCPDCKGEVDVLHRLKQELGPKGLVIISPTQHYGYIAGGDDATREQESRYIELIRERYYSQVVSAPALINEQNFRTYGASTTPTLVLVDRRGIVRLYHPGALPYAELRADIAALL